MPPRKKKPTRRKKKAKTTAKGGRPRLNPEARKSATITITCTPSQREAYETCAADLGFSLSSWVVYAADQIASQHLQRPVDPLHIEKIKRRLMRP